MAAAAIVGAAIIGAVGTYVATKAQSDASESASETQASALDRATQAQLEMFYKNREDSTPWRLAGEFGLEGLKGLTEDYKTLYSRYGEFASDYGSFVDKYSEAINRPGNYLKSPYYSFLQSQGEQSMLRAASAGGGLDSGQLPKDFATFNQGLASQDYGDYLNRLASEGNVIANQGNILANKGNILTTRGNQFNSLAGLGQNALNQTAQLGQNAATNVGNLAVGQGNALANNAINQGNIRANQYSNYANIGSNALNQYYTYKALNNSSNSPWSNPYDQNAGLGADWANSGW